MSKQEKTRQKKFNCRVDFTPMVDMNMLLITFFMLCSSLSKPQTMEISMPSNDKNITDQDRTAVKASKAITLLLAENDRVFYYDGQLKVSDPQHALTESSYNADGIRKMLQDRNSDAYAQMLELKHKRTAGDPQLKVDSIYDAKLNEIKGGKETPTVIIKALDTASYRNLIDALDEMQICGIGKFVIDKITPAEKDLIKKFEGFKAGAAK
jgi:biopolymer transport protein ExbD